MSATPPKDQAQRAILAVKAVITSLQLALKMLTLYAEDHAYCQKSMARLHQDIESFLTTYGSLVLEIRSDCILYEGEIVHEGTSKDGDVSFALWRRRTREARVQLALVEDHRCPYCLEIVTRNDPRGMVECTIWHTLHHKDCWDITGTCQVPHLNN